MNVSRNEGKGGRFRLLSCFALLIRQHLLLSKVIGKVREEKGVAEKLVN